jgi:hypothetical protein
VSVSTGRGAQRRRASRRYDGASPHAGQVPARLYGRNAVVALRVRGGGPGDGRAAGQHAAWLQRHLTCHACCSMVCSHPPRPARSGFIRPGVCWYAGKLTLAGYRQATIERSGGLTKGHSISALAKVGRSQPRSTRRTTSPTSSSAGPSATAPSASARTAQSFCVPKADTVAQGSRRLNYMRNENRVLIRGRMMV